jgi:UDP-2,3-diacylglucosamine hydrolase
MSLEIKDGALFVADAHENGKNRTAFSKLLCRIEAGEAEITQLFLMGDMFDLLVGGVRRMERLFAKEIASLEEIGKKIEVFYFEGNHDFNLDEIFTTVKVIPLKTQPLLFDSACGSFMIAHGDLDGSFLYKLYTAFIRNPFVVAFLDMLDWRGAISRPILDRHEKKDLCVKIDHFDQIALKKMLFYKKCDFIVEGHYHQNQSFVSKTCTYINFGSFACGERLYRFNSKVKPYFEELIFTGV